MGRLIDLDCCSEIRVAIRNVDPYPATVAIELILVNTTAENQPYESLGVQPVRSRAPAGEWLDFQIPAYRLIDSFDEITLRFHRARVREALSARIAIEKFTLTPRGR